jgi:hypothetical protein
MSSYIPILSYTLTSNTNSVTLSNIPTSINGKTIRDLVLNFEFEPSATGTLQMRFNNDSTGIYNWVFMRGIGSSATSEAASSFSQFNIIGVDPTYSTNFYGDVFIFDFAQTNKHKGVLINSKNVELVQTHALRYASTNAINQINIFPNSGNFLSGAKFNLYGIEG